MNGIIFDFESHDIPILGGSFVETEVSSQTCALIAISQICRISDASLGESLVQKIENTRPSFANKQIAKAIRAVENDGGKNVRIFLNGTEQLQFYAEYGDL